MMVSMPCHPFGVPDDGLSTQLEILASDFSGLLWTARALPGQPVLGERRCRDFVGGGAEIVTSTSQESFC